MRGDKSRRRAGPKSSARINRDISPAQLAASRRRMIMAALQRGRNRRPENRIISMLLYIAKYRNGVKNRHIARNRRSDDRRKGNRG